MKNRKFMSVVIIAVLLFSTLASSAAEDAIHEPDVEVTAVEAHAEPVMLGDSQEQTVYSFEELSGYEGSNFYIFSDDSILICDNNSDLFLDEKAVQEAILNDALRFAILSNGAIYTTGGFPESTQGEFDNGGFHEIILFASCTHIPNIDITITSTTYTNVSASGHTKVLSGTYRCRDCGFIGPYSYSEPYTHSKNVTTTPNLQPQRLARTP